MKVFIQGKAFPLSLVLSWTVSIFFGLEVSAQEKLADTPSVEEAPSFSEAEAPELTEEAEKAIERGLKFLVSNQNKDGSWSSQDPENEGGANYAIAGTSLGLMAFMVEGHFPGFGPYGQALDRAKDYLLKRAKDSPTGAMGVKMYEIGLFTIAMSELWGMTSDPEDNKEIQEALERVVEIILRSQNPLGGCAMPRGPTPDRTLRSPRLSSFLSHRHAKPACSFPPKPSKESPVTSAIKPSTSWGGFGYQGKGYTISCTAGGVYSAQLAGNRDTEWVAAALNSLENDPKMFSRKDNGHFYYSHYYAMQAMVQAGEALCQMVSENPRCSHQFATTQRILAGKGKGLSAQDAYGDHHSRDSQPVYSRLSTLSRGLDEQ